MFKQKIWYVLFLVAFIESVIDGLIGLATRNYDMHSYIGVAIIVLAFIALVSEALKEKY